MKRIVIVIAALAVAAAGAVAYAAIPAANGTITACKDNREAST